MIDRLNYWSRFIKIYKNWISILQDRLANNKTGQIRLRNGYTITGSPLSPISTIMDETFLLQVYTPSFMQIKSGDTVVDIGSNIGDFSIFAVLCGAKKVFSYEPDPNSFKDMENNILTNNILNIKPINKAVSDRKGLVDFYATQNNGGNSLFDSGNSISVLKVKSVKLADVFKENNINKINFLKIDCEGGEGLIFKSLPHNTFNKIDKISLEYHDNVSFYNHIHLTEILEKIGYSTFTKEVGIGFGYIYAWKK